LAQEFDNRNNLITGIVIIIDLYNSTVGLIPYTVDPPDGIALTCASAYNYKL